MKATYATSTFPPRTEAYLGTGGAGGNWSAPATRLGGCTVDCVAGQKAVDPARIPIVAMCSKSAPATKAMACDAARGTHGRHSRLRGGSSSSSGRRSGGNNASSDRTCAAHTLAVAVAHGAGALLSSVGAGGAVLLPQSQRRRAAARLEEKGVSPHVAYACSFGATGWAAGQRGSWLGGPGGGPVGPVLAGLSVTSSYRDRYRPRSPLHSLVMRRKYVLWRYALVCERVRPQIGIHAFLDRGWPATRDPRNCDSPLSSRYDSV